MTIVTRNMQSIRSLVLHLLLVVMMPLRTRAFAPKSNSPTQPCRFITSCPARSLRFFATPNDNDRSDGLRQSLLQVGQVLDTKSDNVIRVGSTVVANSNLPDLQIWQFQSYTVQDIWDQGIASATAAANDTDAASSLVEKIACTTLDDPPPPKAGVYTRYVSLYSAKHHDRPVTVNPAEVTLVTLRNEVQDSILQALPLFGFWTALAFSFATKYNERYGGNLLDAFWGR